MAAQVAAQALSFVRASGDRSPATATDIEWLSDLRVLVEHRSIANPQRFAGLISPDFALATRLRSLANTLPSAVQLVLDRELQIAIRLHFGIQQRLRVLPSQ